MVIIMLGDVVGQSGCEAVRALLPGLRRDYRADAVIVNGENSAQGNGILPSSAKHLFDSGANVITTGNHVFRRREIYDLLEAEEGIIRPANFSPECPGTGVFRLDLLRRSIAVVNLMGTAGMEPLANPFDTADRILKTLDTPFVVLDFHAETTSEKRAMGFYPVSYTHLDVYKRQEKSGFPERQAFRHGQRCQCMPAKPQKNGVRCCQRQRISDR